MPYVYSQGSRAFVQSDNEQSVHASMETLKSHLLFLSLAIGDAKRSPDARTAALKEFNRHLEMWNENVDFLTWAPVVEEAKRTANSLNWPPAEGEPAAPAGPQESAGTPRPGHG